MQCHVCHRCTSLQFTISIQMFIHASHINTIRRFSLMSNVFTQKPCITRYKYKNSILGIYFHGTKIGGYNTYFRLPLLAYFHLQFLVLGTDTFPFMSVETKYQTQLHLTTVITVIFSLTSPTLHFHISVEITC